MYVRITLTWHRNSGCNEWTMQLLVVLVLTVWWLDLSILQCRMEANYA